MECYICKKDEVVGFSASHFSRNNVPVFHFALCNNCMNKQIEIYEKKVVQE